MLSEHVRDHVGLPDERQRSVTGERLRNALARSGALPALVLVLVVGSIVSPDFFTLDNFRNVLIVTSVVGLLAVGQGLVILAGGAGIDLSVGAAMALATIVGARMQQHGSGGVVVGALAAGGLVGLINAVGVTVARLEPFIVTLGTLTIAQGAAYYLSAASPIAIMDPMNLPWLNGEVAGIPIPAIVFLVVVLIGQAVLSKTVFGRELYIVGGNEEAARYAGIPVERRRFVVYVVSGLCAGGAALLTIAQLQSGSPLYGQTYNLGAIAAVVVGGTRLSGGTGSVLGTGIGVLIIALVADLLGLLNVNEYLQLVVTGLIVIGVVALNRSEGRRGRDDAMGLVALVSVLVISGAFLLGVVGPP